MNNELQLLVSDECDRLLAELRSISSNSVLAQIQDEIVSLKLNLFSNSFQISQILSPFEKIITDEQTTDFITSLALSSVNTFISFNLLQSSLDVDSICNTIKNCQFQSTSDFDCAAVSYRILTCIISLCRTDLLTSNSLLIVLDYVMTEIKNSDRNISPILIDALSSISTYIFMRSSNNDFLIEKLLTNLYFLCQYECYYRQCGLVCLLQVSRVTKNRNDSLMAVACSLFHKFIISIDSRDNFVLILRLFTHVFIDKYMIYPLPFSKCFLELLNFIEPTNSNKNQQSPTSQSQLLTLNYHLKRVALEVISDFISQPNFLLNLFVNLNGRTYFPNLFDKLVKVYFTNLDKKNSILKLNIPDVKILSNNQHNFYFTINKKEIIENFNSEKDHYNELLHFSEKFNENPSFVLKNSDNFYTPHKIALNLIESPNLSRKQIGEFFAKNKPFCMETLREYLELLDFSHLDFDSSIRLFLSGFQIAGEGQIVDRIFEYFSKRFFNCSKDKVHFKNQESVHVLAYAWLMMHTSFHNNNVTKKPTFGEFLKMLENQNEGENFDENFLCDIFESVKNVKVPFEDSEQEGSVAHWRLLLCRQKIIGFKFVKFPKIESNNNNNLNEDEIQRKSDSQIETEKVSLNEETNSLKIEDETQKLNITKVTVNSENEIVNEGHFEKENKDEQTTKDDENRDKNDDQNKVVQNESENKVVNIENKTKQITESEIIEDEVQFNSINEAEIEQNEKEEEKKENEIDIQKEVEDDLHFLFEDENKNNPNTKEEEEKDKEKIEKSNNTKDEDDVSLDSLIEEIESSMNESEDTSQKENESSENTLECIQKIDRGITFSDTNNISSSIDSSTENQFTIPTENKFSDSSTDTQINSQTKQPNTNPTPNQISQPNINPKTTQIVEQNTNPKTTQIVEQNTNPTPNQIVQPNINPTTTTTFQPNTNQLINQTDQQSSNQLTNQIPQQISFKDRDTNQPSTNEQQIPLKNSSETDSLQTSTSQSTTSDTITTFSLQTSPQTTTITNNEHVPLFEIEKEMFQRIWNLESSKVIDLCIANTRIFHSVCMSASKFNMTDVIDNFVMLFSKNSVEELLDKNIVKEEKRTSNLFLLGTIVKNYGYTIRYDGWTSYVKLLTTLLELDLLNDDTLTFKNIAEDMKPIILCHKLVNTRKSRRNSMFSLFLSRRPSFDDLKRPTSHSNLREFVSKSGIEKFVENNESEDSLFNLVSAIINVSKEVQSGLENDKMRIAFCVILIEKVVTEKKNLVSFLKNKKVFEKITDDLFVPVLSKKSGSFLSTLFFNEAFVIVLDLWSIKPLQIDLIYFIDKVFTSPQICQNEVQIDMIEKCLSLFFKKFFQSFILMQHLKGILNLIQVGILQDSKPSFVLLKKFDKITIGDFENVRFPLIQANTAVILVENQKLNSSIEKLNEIQNEPKKRKTFSEMKPLIFVKNTSEKQWETLFNEILFPLTMKKVRYDDLILLILETFEYAVNKLCKLQLFEPIWFRLLSLTLDFSSRCDADVKSQIEARLAGCISQMKKFSIFADENSKIWSLTKSNVERVFPSII